MTTPDVPDFLTVEEAARILRIGRTAAYTLANRWLDTDGGDGLPVERVGGLLRVPRIRFEAHYGIVVTAVPPPRQRRRPAGTRRAAHGPAQDIPRPKAVRRRRSDDGGTAQGGLPFAG